MAVLAVWQLRPSRRNLPKIKAPAKGAPGPRSPGDFWGKGGWGEHESRRIWARICRAIHRFTFDHTAKISWWDRMLCSSPASAPIHELPALVRSAGVATGERRRAGCGISIRQSSRARVVRNWTLLQNASDDHHGMRSAPHVMIRRSGWLQTRTDFESDWQV
jgi:hypothetical protein